VAGLAGSLVSVGVGVALAIIFLRPQPAGGPPAKEGEPAFPADLALVPPDAYGLVSVELAALRRSPSGAEPGRLAARRLRDFLVSSEEALGLAPEQIERVVLFLTRAEDGRKLVGPLLVVTTTTPYTRSRVLRALVPREEERKSRRGVGYFGIRASAEPVPGRPAAAVGNALYCAGDRTFLFGPEEEVRRILDRPRGEAGQGPWGQALQLAQRRRLGVVGFYPPDLLEHWLPARYFKERPSLKPLFGARTGVVVLDVDKDAHTRLELLVEFPPQSVGKLNEEAVRDVLLVMEKELSRFLPALLVLAPDLAWLKTFAASLKRPELRREGATVVAAVTVPVEPAVLVAYLQPVMLTQQGAQRMVHANNLKQLALALHSFAERHGGRLPPAALCDPRTGKPLLSWRVALLPYLEQGDLYKRFKRDEPWDSEHNIKLLPRMPRLYAVGSGKGDEATTSVYRVFVGKGTAFEPPGAGQPPVGVSLSDFPDGTSNTVLIVEAGKAVPWTKPEELEYEPGKPLPGLGGVSPQGFYAALADGSVRFIPMALGKEAIRAFFTRNAGDGPKSP
jgi:hypothetical protein